MKIRRQISRSRYRGRFRRDFLRFRDRSVVDPPVARFLPPGFFQPAPASEPETDKLDNFSKINDTARFLAGMPGGGNAKSDAELRNTSAWKSHAARMDQTMGVTTSNRETHLDVGSHAVSVGAGTVFLSLWRAGLPLGDERFFRRRSRRTSWSDSKASSPMPEHRFPEQRSEINTGLSGTFQLPEDSDRRQLFHYQGHAGRSRRPLNFAERYRPCW